MNAAQRQVATDLWTKPIGLSHKPAFRLLDALYYIHLVSWLLAKSLCEFSQCFYSGCS